MGARYTVTKASAAIAAGTDALTITAPAGRSLKIWAIRATGHGTASASNEITVSRSTAGTTPTAVTPTPLNSDSAAATFTAASAWATPPTVGVTISRLGVNSNGAVQQMVFPPGQEIDVPGGGQVSLRTIAGTGPVGFEVVVEQV